MRDAFDAAQRLHECLLDKHTLVENISIPELGDVKLRLLLQEGRKYTIGFIRNGMYITDNLFYFNEPFKRFPLYKEFTAVIEPDGPSESEWFKRLENPRHDTLSADRILDPNLREIGNKAFGKLAGEIRERIKKFAKKETETSIELDDLNDFFATDEKKLEDDTDTEIDPRAKLPTEIQPSRSQSRSRRHERSIRPTPDPEPNPEPDPEPRPQPSPNPPPDPPPAPQPRRVLQSIELIGERAILPDISTPKNRRLYFTSPTSSDITIYTYASGLNSREELPVINSSEGEVKNGAIQIRCDADVRVFVDVEFESAYQGPVEFVAFRNVDAEDS